MENENENLAINVAVLQAIVPRVEEALKNNGIDFRGLSAKMDSIASNMVTKEMIDELKTANDNLSKKTNSLQYQLFGVLAALVIGSIPGTQTIISSLIVNFIPRLF